MDPAAWVAVGTAVVGSQGLLTWLLTRRQRSATLGLTRAQETKMVDDVVEQATERIAAQRDECRENLAMAITYIIDVAEAARNGECIPPVPIPLWMVVRNA